MEVSVKELKKLLYENGADIIGFADLSTYRLEEDELKFGISIGVKLPKDIVKSISNGPNIEYYNIYNDLNSKLDLLANICAKYLIKCGYKAQPQTTLIVKETSDFRTDVPHKTVAVKAGLGWIGKNALLVTDDYGSGIRLTSILTNMKIYSQQEVVNSKCGQCMICRDACPGNAILGKEWHEGIDRDDIYNPILCRTKARELAFNSFSKIITLCGKCIEVCPYTRRYINS